MGKDWGNALGKESKLTDNSLEGFTSTFTMTCLWLLTRMVPIAEFREDLWSLLLEVCCT